MSIVSNIRPGIAAGVVLAGVIASLMLPSAASAAEPEGLLVSLDGEHYSKTPAGSLFTGDLVVVPGSHATREVSVRNDSDFAGELRIAVLDTTADRPGFLESLTMSAMTPATTGLGPVRMTTDDACTVIFAGEILEPGESTAVSITLAMDSSASNAEQGATAGADLRVSLRQPGVSAADAFDCTAGTGIPVTDPNPASPASPASPGEPVAPENPGTTWSEDTGATDDSGSAEDTDSAAKPGETTAPPAAPSARGTDTPPGVLAAPASGAQTALFPWIGVAALASGAVAFVVLRRRNQRAD